MGMYNEVWKKCPRCGDRCYVQIAQVVLGFGNFDLDRPETLLEDPELDVARLRLLEERVREETFHCECGHRFRIIPDEERKEREEIVTRLRRDAGEGS